MVLFATARISDGTAQTAGGDGRRFLGLQLDATVGER
jgi:hypothetical protein